MAAPDGRTAEQVRRDIENERDRLATAVDDLRSGLGEATNINAKLRGKLPVAAHGVTKMIQLAKDDAAHNKSGSAIAFVVGTFGAVWAASGAMGSVIKAVNRAYDRIETRPFWKVRLIAIVLVVATGLVTAG